MRITSKGQVTIPQEIREKAGLLPMTEVEFDYDGRSVRIVKVRQAGAKGRGRAFVARLKSRGDIGICTDEIMALTRQQ